MKAFKQINFHSETRFFWSYAIALSILSIFIIISPVLAQTGQVEEDPPEIHIDIKKEYDKEGNVIRYDSSKTWCWHGNEFSLDQYDSIFNDLEKNTGSIYHRNHYPPIGSIDLQTGPPLHRFWNWDETDSSVTSFLEEFIDEEFLDCSKQFSNPNLSWNFPFNDSLEINEHINEMQEFSEKFKQYQKEHQELIEKFFDQPWQNEDINLQAKPNLNIPNKLPEEIKSSNI